MGKVTLLFAGKSYDTDVQSVRENQIVIFDGPYNMRQRMVVAGNSDNVCIENPAPVQTAAPETVADARVEIVEYSAKSIAVFGDTKPLRDTLRDLNGLFRAYLTHDGTRCAGWIFSKRREQEVRSALAAYLK